MTDVDRRKKRRKDRSTSVKQPLRLLNLCTLTPLTALEERLRPDQKNKKEKIVWPYLSFFRELLILLSPYERHDDYLMEAINISVFSSCPLPLTSRQASFRWRKMTGNERKRTVIRRIKRKEKHCVRLSITSSYACVTREGKYCSSHSISWRATNIFYRALLTVRQ